MSQKQVDCKRLKSIANAAKKLIPAVTLAAAALYISDVYASDVSLCATINGEYAGYVNSTKDVSDALAKFEAHLNDIAGEDYDARIDVSYELVHTNSDERLSEAELSGLFWSEVKDDFTEAYMLYVDDRHVAASEDGGELQEIIDRIEAELLSVAGDEFGGIKISNHLRIEKQPCLISMIKTADEIDALINPLASDADNSTEETKALETEAEGEKITARMQTLSVASPLYDVAETKISEDEDLTLDYNFVNTVTLDEIIYFETRYEEDPYTYEGNERTTRKGVNGKKTVTYEILYSSDGDIIGRTAVSETLITEAVDEIITVGTSEIPDAVSTGELIWPCDRPKGISSYYGWRDLYGKPDFHLGIDIPDEPGSPIWAADGGEVVWAGNTPSYGNSVRIQHADGVMTVYAHLDTMSVRVGDKVYKGQNVGTMGRTGVATGNHLHFEVRINNQTTDPMEYLPEA